MAEKSETRNCSGGGGEMMDTEMMENMANPEGEEGDYDGGSMSPDVSDSSSSSIEDDDEVNSEKIAELKKQISANPYHYDPHVELINLLRKTGDLQELRDARENMSKIFPLTTELWLEWLTDESRLAVTEKDREAVTKLFERAIKDYTSVVLWLEYAQFSIGSMGMKDGIEHVRSVFERAITAVGLNVVQGAMIWEAYREFENALLSTIQPSAEVELSEEQKEQIKQQRSKVMNIFKRQLSVPLLEMDKTFEEYQEWLGEEIDKVTHQQYKKASEKLLKLEPFENALLASEAPHLEEYKQYIQYEKEHGDPARVQCIYERAIVDNCLSVELWLEYTKYLDSQLKIGNIILPTYERSVRNCPWALDLWIGYIRAMERNQQPHEKIKEIVERALQAGFTQGEEFRQLWMAYLDYLRRRVKWEQENSSELEDLRKTFEQAADHIYQAFGSEGDPMCTILQYWAYVEARFCQNMAKAREIWNEIMKQGHSSKANMWLEFANLERMRGDDKHCRKVLLRGLQSSSDWPESVGEMLLQFERQEGTLETFDVALERYNTRMKIVGEQRQKAAEKAAALAEIEAEKSEAKKQARAEKKKREKQQEQAKESLKRKNQESPPSKSPEAKKVKVDSEGFKIPPAPQASSKPQENKSTAQQEAKDKGGGEAPSSSQHGMTIQHDSSKDDRTVFLSNLAFNLDEDKIREVFKDVGEITDLRLVRDYKGRSKGYCYLEFSTPAIAKAALEKDRTKIDGRPVFVSRCEDRKQGQGKKFKYAQGLEKNKLFIKGLPFTVTEKDLEDIYKEFGCLKEIRLVTYRNGHSKGLAYVEYEDEVSASTALVKTDGMQMGEHTISVAISNPPTRKNKSDSVVAEGSVQQAPVQSLGSGSREAPRGGHARTQVPLLLPRALSRPSSNQQDAKTTPASTTAIQNGSAQGKEEQKMSNADFRSMLLGK